MKMSKTKNFFYILLFFILVLGLWLGISFVPQPECVELLETRGFYDLSESDFENTVYRTDNYWESWPEKLYTPEDFANGAVTEPQILPVDAYRTLQYATHKIRLKLTSGKTYGISLNSSDYSMRIFINGAETDSVGRPGATRETTVPRVQERDYYFTPVGDTTEIIVQAANFVHGKKGANPPSFIIGSYEKIARRTTANLAVSFMIVGCLLTASLYHFGLFCLNRKRKTVLIFSLCCLLLAAMNKKLIMLFFPEYNWFVAIRIEYIVHVLAFSVIILFLDQLHPRLLHKSVTRGYYSLSALYALMTLSLDTTVFTGLLVYFEAASVLLIGYVLVRLTMALRKGTLKHWLSFAGVLVLGLLGTNDILYYRGIILVPPIAGQFFMAPAGMVFFVFCYALVLSVEYAETERAMLDAQVKEQALVAENATLDRINRLKTDLMTTISHEARTPLAVLASYSGLVSMELRDKGVDEQTAADLDKIAFEAKRVAGLIDGMKKLTLHSEESSRRTSLNLGELVSQTARLYRHIMERGGLKMEIQIEADLPPVFGSSEELTQVLFNLLQNAKNHTAIGSVCVSVKRQDDKVVVTVSDTGEGIPEELRSRVFERGVHGNGAGTGLGLAICKEVVEDHGGSIEIESKADRGTVVSFTLPVYKEGIGDE